MRRAESVTFGTLTAAHHSELIELWQRCEIRIEPEDELSKLERFIENPLSDGYVATVDGAVVGTALCGSDGRFGYIHHLAVDPSHRRQGIGTALIDRCRRFLVSELGINTVAVFVWDTNETGLRFWQMRGFDRMQELSVLVLRDFD